MAGRPSYYNLPGYYYLHRKIPFYDGVTGSDLKGNVETVSSLVSHIVSADPGFSVPGYSLEQEFGEVRILRRGENEPPVRPWLDHAPVMVSNRTKRIMRRIDPDGPSPRPISGSASQTGKGRSRWRRKRKRRPNRAQAIGLEGTLLTSSQRLRRSRDRKDAIISRSSRGDPVFRPVLAPGRAGRPGPRPVGRGLLPAGNALGRLDLG